MMRRSERGPEILLGERRNRLAAEIEARCRTREARRVRSRPQSEEQRRDVAVTDEQLPRRSEPIEVDAPQQTRQPVPAARGNDQVDIFARGDPVQAREPFVVGPGEALRPQACGGIHDDPMTASLEIRRCAVERRRIGNIARGRDDADDERILHLRPALACPAPAAGARASHSAFRRDRASAASRRVAVTIATVSSAATPSGSAARSAAAAALRRYSAQSGVRTITPVSTSQRRMCT
jgi:hypothetical protein